MQMVMIMQSRLQPKQKLQLVQHVVNCQSFVSKTKNNNMDIVDSKQFSNGQVFCLKTKSNRLIETTDTFLPFYTKDVKDGSNELHDYHLGDRSERWMIGVSTMSGCPLKCKFCATGNMKSSKNLSSADIIEQVEMMVALNPQYDPNDSKEFKINYTRMGEPFCNINAVRNAIEYISEKYPNTHHYVSTIGVKGSDFSWIKGNITLQISLHACNDAKRDFLIPYSNKMSIAELGQIRTQSNLKTTINMTLVDEEDFDIEVLKKYFDPEHFFIKLSPINPNEYSKQNITGDGVIQIKNLK